VFSGGLSKHLKRNFYLMCIIPQPLSGVRNVTQTSTGSGRVEAYSVKNPRYLHEALFEEACRGGLATYSRKAYERRIWTKIGDQPLLFPSYLLPFSGRSAYNYAPCLLEKEGLVSNFCPYPSLVSFSAICLRLAAIYWPMEE
jgi:hypothetical protein